MTALGGVMMDDAIESSSQPEQTRKPDCRVESHLPLVRVSLRSARTLVPSRVEELLGIDLGTAQSRVAWFNSRAARPEVLLNADGESQTPTIVYFGAKDILVGKAAAQMAQFVGERINVVSSVKRLLGQAVSLPIPDRDIGPLAVVTQVFQQLKKDAENGQLRQLAKRVVLSVPVNSEAAKQDQLREAALLAGFEEVVLVQEPIAAVVAYDQAGIEIGDHLLICDIGAGSCSVSLVARTETGSFRVALPPHSQRLGGDDFDRLIYHLSDRAAHKENSRTSVANGSEDLAFLLACRRGKEELSRQLRSNVRYQFADGTHCDLQLTKAGFEAVIRPACQQIARMARAAYDEASAHGLPVDTVILIGGSSRVPMLRQELTAALPVEPCRWHCQDIAVALGAACFANSLWGYADGATRQRVRVETITTLSDLIYRLSKREAEEKEHMATEYERQCQEHYKRIVDAFATQAAAIDADQRRLRLLLPQRLANHELTLAQELVSALLRLSPNDSEAQQAQVFLDGHFETIGLVRATKIQNTVRSLAVDPQGDWALATSKDTVVSLSLTSGNVSLPVCSHGGIIFSLDLHPDLQRMATGSSDKIVHIWSLTEWKAVAQWSAGYSIHAVRFLVDGKHLAVGGDNDDIKLWEFTQDVIVGTLSGHKGRILSIDRSADGRFLLSGGADKIVRLWEIERNRQVQQLVGHRAEVNAVRMHPGGQIAVSAGDDGVIRVWDLGSGREVGRWEGHEGSVWCLEITLDGRHVVSGGEDTTIRVWDISTGWEVRRFIGHNKPVECIALFSEEKTEPPSAGGGRTRAQLAEREQMAVSGSADGTVRLWALGV